MDLYDAAMVVIRRANLERFTATLVTGIIASVTLVVATEWTQKKRPEEITLEQKITALTKNLNDSARAISEVEREVQARRQLADKLRADAEGGAASKGRPLRYERL
jgi:FtsZ-interacting cell division protein ZipA